MEIGSVAQSTSEVQAGAAVKVAAMELDSMRQQAEDVNKLIQQSQVVSDPASGKNLDVLA
ncbi:MAG: hypothetical protein LBD07_04725 [Spirochaetaceae bacterium]|jgi:hypothetical protein|nr:hypothetical protein [Spirochaetaceae bacterium]